MQDIGGFVISSHVTAAPAVSLRPPGYPTDASRKGSQRNRTRTTSLGTPLRPEQHRLVIPSSHKHRRNKDGTGNEAHNTTRTTSSTPRTQDGNTRLWLAGTGCPYDLVQTSTLSRINRRQRHPARAPTELETANGKVTAKTTCAMKIGGLNENIEPYCLESTPDVITLGYRCMEIGYSFHWPTGQRPYFLSPTNEKIKLEAINYVPYLADDCKANLVHAPLPQCTCVASECGHIAQTIHRTIRTCATR